MRFAVYPSLQGSRRGFIALSPPLLASDYDAFAGASAERGSRAGCALRWPRSAGISATSPAIMATSGSTSTGCWSTPGVRVTWRAALAERALACRPDVVCGPLDGRRVRRAARRGGDRGGLRLRRAARCRSIGALPDPGHAPRGGARAARAAGRRCGQRRLGAARDARRTCWHAARKWRAARACWRWATRRRGSRPRPVRRSIA